MGTAQPYARVRIVSDGTGKGTHIYDAATGQEIPPNLIRSVAWKVDGAGPARVTVELVGATLEAEGTLVAGEADHEDIRPIGRHAVPSVRGEALKRCLEERAARALFF